MTHIAHKSSRSAAPGFNRTKIRRGPRQPAPRVVITKLSDLVGELHELLESYAPVWYTSTLEKRVRTTLTSADGVLPALAERR